MPYTLYLSIKGRQKMIFLKFELGALHGCTWPNIIHIIDSTHYNTENIVHFRLMLFTHFFKSILTSNIHRNCFVLWFTKAIVCCTGVISCISPVDVCYSQHLSFFHHNSFSLVPRLFFSPSDVWFWST